jgi:hypothetical protein
MPTRPRPVLPQEMEKGIAAAKPERLRGEFKLLLLDRRAAIAARLDIRLTA